MPISQDAKSGVLKILKALPQNGVGVWIAHQLNRLPNGKLPATYQSQWVKIPRSGGNGTIRTMVIGPADRSKPLPVVVHFHGGGHVLGTPQGSSLDRVVNLIQAQDAIFVIPDYQLATQAPFPAGFDDCYDALLWAVQNAASIGGRPDQIAIGGESAGGGLTLSIALRVRDEGKVNIAFQFPIYPMADDREENWTPIPEEDLSWPVELNRIGWNKLLGPGRRGSAGVSGYEAPARASNLSDLPPTFTFIGRLDLFLNETRTIVERLQQAGVHVDYREFENVYHGQETMAPKSANAHWINAHYRETFAKFVQQFRAPQP